MALLFSTPQNEMALISYCCGVNGIFTWIWEYLLRISRSAVLFNYVGLNYRFYRSFFVLKYRNLWSMKTIGYFSYLVAYFGLLVAIVFESLYTSHSIQLEYYCLFWIFLNSMRVLCYNPIVPESFSNWYPWVRWRVLCCWGM